MTQEKNYTTRGGQIFFHNLRMFFQIQGWVVRWCLIVSVFLSIAYTYFITPIDEVLKAYNYVKFNLLSIVFQSTPNKTAVMNYQGVSYKNTILAFSNNDSLAHSFRLVWFDIQLGFLLSLISVGVIAALVLRYFKKKGEEQTENKFIRGTKIATVKELSNILKKQKKLSSLVIAGVRFLKQNFEVQHVLLDGTTGTGKSVLLRCFLLWIRARGDKAIIYDKGCTFVGKMYDSQKDVLLNPFDERSVYWDVWLDAKSPSDFENIASALIPQTGEGDPFWVLAARTIFSSTAYKMSLEPVESRTTERFLELMLTSELEDLSGYLKGSESSALVSDKAAKIAISIKSILAAYIKSLRFLEGLEQKDENGHERRRFSITEWVQDDDQKGFLFFSSNASQHVSLRPLISAWLATASTAQLGLTPDPKRRIWVIMDEMPTLHKLPELAETIAEVRKFGGCYVIGIQSYAQLLKNYGTNTADEIFDLLNTRFFFRAPSEKMARVSSADLGEQEYNETSEQYSYGAASVRDGVSLGRKRTKHFAVSSTEIMQLEDLQFWLKSAGDYPIVKHMMTFDHMKDINKPFIPREMPLTEKGKKLDAIIAWNQVASLQKVDKEDRDKLFGIFSEEMEEDTKSERERKMAKIKKDAENYSEHDKETIRETKQENDTSKGLSDVENDIIVDDVDIPL
ncbi:type IV conjugative transfer system coupling protein TraD [Vibrio furnissii]|uniref:type IV conjugative transfer system coupling protein TraD n=1 Tax=Vibrio furnissii TaxID=29494 RepID=UPI001EECD58E|nr:type IV conjugative transfer system coupling protein TraD [Vibrio furnissii]MCG6230274.1 type IV conjugative transfer system coupling protein TraD [Vibrio furnissii]MCG6268473.1 type IV conjugative transfer system coupling protein TraD [Vibrio furnissii]